MKSLLAILAGLGITWLLLKYLDIQRLDRTRWTGIWAVMTAAAFVAGHFLLFSLCVVIACVVLARTMRDRIPTLYVLLLPLMPAYSYYVRGVPGINYLLLITYVHVLIAALLVPAYMEYRSSQSRQPAERSSIDVFFIGFCLWQMSGAFVHMISFTDSLRSCVDIALMSLIPYLAVSRLARRRDQLQDMLTALVFTGLLQFGISIAETAVGQSPYFDLVYRLNTNPIPGLSYLTQIRFGFARVHGTIDGGFGLLMVAALSAFLCLAQLTRMPRWRWLLGVGMMTFPIVLTGSRGTWIMTGLMLAIRIGYPLIRTPGRFVTALIIGSFVIPSAQNMLLSSNDQFGTFAYRQRLLDTFYPVVFEKPFFGWGGLTQVFQTGRFYHLLQGEGIIDMVNTFLGVGLQFGVTGVVFFGGIFIFAVVPLLRRLQNAPVEIVQHDGPYVQWICSIMPPLAFFLVTTSLVGHTPQYLALLAAASAALCHRLERNKSSGLQVASQQGSRVQSLTSPTQ